MFHESKPRERRKTHAARSGEHDDFVIAVAVWGGVTMSALLPIADLPNDDVWCW